MQVIYSILTTDITNQDVDIVNTWFDLLTILNKRLSYAYPKQRTRSLLNEKSLSVYTKSKQLLLITSSDRDINLSEDRLLTLDILNDLCLFGEILD